MVPAVVTGRGSGPDSGEFLLTVMCVLVVVMVTS